MKNVADKIRGQLELIVVNLTLQPVIQVAGKIKFKIDSGVLTKSGCGMSAVQTPALALKNISEFT